MGSTKVRGRPSNPKANLKVETSMGSIKINYVPFGDMEVRHNPYLT